MPRVSPVRVMFRNCCTRSPVRSAGAVRSRGRRGGGFSSAASVGRVVVDDDPAEVEHDADVGDGQGAAGVLLDEQRRSARRRRRARAAASKICATIRGASPSDGSSSSSTFGLRHQRPADDEHLPLAAGQRVRDARCAGRRAPGTACRPARGRPAGTGPPRHSAAEPEVLLDGQLGDDAAALGHVRQPEAGIASTGVRVDVLAVEHDAAPRLGPDQPGDGAQQRGLAGAVGAEHGGDLAARGGEARRRRAP